MQRPPVTGGLFLFPNPRKIILIEPPITLKKDQFMYSKLSMPKGFECAGISAGIKTDGGRDMALILSNTPAASAAVFTTNQVCAAPVKVCREHLKHGLA